MGYDVVVVGGGPAGSSCARVLAQKGARVLLIEKRKFPRPKPCGGCLSERIASYLPEGWTSTVLSEIKGGVLGYRGEFAEREAGEKIASVVDRSDFDLFLLKEAEKAGADVREGVSFLGLEEKPLRVHTTEGTFTADFLVGADGFYSRVRKHLGFQKRRYFRSLECSAELTLKDRVILELGVVSRGYLWIFPRGREASVGVATTGRENLLEMLDRHFRNHPLFGEVSLRKPRGWMIPFILKKEEAFLGRGRVLLTGDAASLTDPLLGEGIFYAVRSGLTAGEFLSTGKPKDYREAMLEEIVPELVYAGKIAALAYGFQGIAFRMGAGPAMERLFALLRGEETFRGVYRKGLPEFLFTAFAAAGGAFFNRIVDRILRR